MKVLLAVDDSKFSLIAVQAVSVQASPLSDEVRVLHVVDTMNDLFPEMADYVATENPRCPMQEEGEKLVSKVSTFLRTKNLTVSTAVEFGDPKSEILAAAEEWCADLIVVGSHGRKGLDRFLLGSVADTVARYAQCSTQVVRVLPGAKAPESLARLDGGRIRRILLAIDGSRFSEAAIQLVSELTQPDSIELRLLCVVETPVLKFLRKLGRSARSFRAVRDAEAKQTEELLKRTAARLRSRGLNASTAMEFGEPKVKILEQASKWGADLIVLGSHGRKGLKHFLLGSVSETVARHAICSVEIVRVPLGRTRQR